MKDSVRRRIRTAFQTTMAVASILGVVVPVLLASLEVSLPPKVYAVLAGAGAAVVGVSTGLVKVMTMDPVEKWLQTHAPWLAAAEPAPTEPDNRQDLSIVQPIN